MVEPVTEQSRMQAWDARSRPLIVAAALTPVVLAFVATDRFDRFILLVDVLSWVVFVADFSIRQRIDRTYWRSGSGIFDLLIIGLTFPYYIFPVAVGSEFMTVFRLARLIRLVSAAGLGRKSVQAFRRLGTLGIWVAGLTFFAALLVRHAEPVESGFETFGDALWWALVSFTTVGYGDLYPVTPLGRFAGVLMMIAGLAALGSVAAILGSAIGSSDNEDEDSVETRILREVESLRSEMADIRQRLDGDT